MQSLAVQESRHASTLPIMPHPACVHMHAFSVQAGADANARDDNGHTALDAAAAEGDRAIIDLLLSKTTAYIDDWTTDGIVAHARSAGPGANAASAGGNEVRSANTQLLLRFYRGHMA